MTILRRNSGAFGSPGDAINGTNSASGGDAFTFTTGSPTVTSDGMDVGGAPVAKAVGWTGVTGSTTFQTSAYIKRTGTASATTMIVQVRNGASAMVAGVNIRNDSRLTIVNRSGTSLYTAATLTLNTIYRVELIGEVKTASTGILTFNLYDGDSTTALDTFTASTADLGTTATGGYILGKQDTTKNVYLTGAKMQYGNTNAATGPWVDKPTVNAIAARNVKSLASVSTTATLASGTADSWTFTQTAGPTVTISGTGATRTFTAPATTTGGTVTISVVATKSGTDSDPVSFDVAVKPHQHWYFKAGAWIPRIGAPIT